MALAKKNYPKILKDLKREAKRLSKAEGIALAKAQECLARKHGFQHLHELTSLASPQAQPGSGAIRLKSRVGSSSLPTSPFRSPVQTCPHCGSENLEVEDMDPEDFEDMTEGQQADYEAGFGRWSHCNDCGATVDHD